jgi:pSer/pThr/pTyr-binding forkhead associated (FHA) protein
MPLRLRVIPPASRSHESGRTPPTGERSVDFDDAVTQIRIGRRPDLELTLPFSPLSGVHARLVRSEDKTEWLLEDLGSTNGTFVAGERLKPGIKHPIPAGTVIKLAEVKVIFDGEMRGFERTEVLKEVRGTPLRGMPVAGTPVRGTPVNGTPGKGTPLKGTPVKGSAVKNADAVGTPVMGTPVKSAELRAAEAQVAEVKAAEAKAAELRAAEVRAAELRVAEMRAAEMKAEMRAAELRAAEAKIAEAKAAEVKVVDPTETFVRRKTSELPPHAPAAVPYLTAVDGIKDDVKTFRLEQRDHAYMFGRTKRCEFRVSTSEVSREHASFVRRNDGIYVNDLGSVNGVLVNNTRVTDFRLYDGDLIQLGHIKLRLFDPTETGRRLTDSAMQTPSRLAPHEHGPAPESPPPPPERSVSFRAEPRPELHAEFHPAIAGALAAETGHRPRRQSVRVMFTQSWEGSSKFRYGVVIIAAAVLAVCAAVVGSSFLE